MNPPTNALRHALLAGALACLCACSSGSHSGTPTTASTSAPATSSTTAGSTSSGGQSAPATTPGSGSQASTPTGTQGSGPNGTRYGTATSPYPTITNLAFEWPIQGDANLDCVVTVRYRPQGSATWLEAMPLRRVPAGSYLSHSWPDLMSGSVFDLSPDTAYEVELSLVDPDGGQATHTLTVSTRAVPRPMVGAPVLQASPATLQSVAAGASPGDVIELASGNYGDFAAPGDGSAGKLIVYRAASGATPQFSRFAIRFRKFVQVEGISVTGAVGIDMRGAERCAVRHCDVTMTAGGYFGIGTTGTYDGTNECYIADNVVTGPVSWTQANLARGEGEGIVTTGHGNVICFNRVVGFRDGISLLEDTNIRDQRCNDAYNNEISGCVDDGVEWDFAQGNCRVLRNRLTNVFMGVSSQPSLGGPTYFLRNAMYNVTEAATKLHRFSQGDVVLHNTVVKTGDGMACYTSETFDHAYFRNNLWIGGPLGSGGWAGSHATQRGEAATMYNPGPGCSFDYDAFGTYGSSEVRGRIGSQRFDDLAQLLAGPHEQHALQVEPNLGVFDGVPWPVNSPGALLPAQDLRPRAGSSVVGKGLSLPNVNDATPAVGAYEAGQALPTYGPRGPGVDESNTPPWR